MYEEAATQLAAAIHRKFFVPATSGYLDTRQTHLVMPLIAGVVPAEHTDGVWAALPTLCAVLWSKKRFQTRSFARNKK